MDTPLINQIELPIWTICTFRVLNPQQWSLAEESVLEDWNGKSFDVFKTLRIHGRQSLFRKINVFSGISAAIVWVGEIRVHKHGNCIPYCFFNKRKHISWFCTKLLPYYDSVITNRAAFSFILNNKLHSIAGSLVRLAINLY